MYPSVIHDYRRPNSIHEALAAIGNGDEEAHVGDRQVRNRGTIGGSICWNYIAACMPVVALTLDAAMDLASSRGERSMPAQEFIGAPLETARRDDELLVSVQLPPPPANAGSAY